MQRKFVSVLVAWTVFLASVTWGGSVYGMGKVSWGAAFKAREYVSALRKDLSLKLVTGATAALVTGSGLFFSPAESNAFDRAGVIPTAGQLAEHTQVDLIERIIHAPLLEARGLEKRMLERRLKQATEVLEDGVFLGHQILGESQPLVAKGFMDTNGAIIFAGGIALFISTLYVWDNLHRYRLKGLVGDSLHRYGWKGLIEMGAGRVVYVASSTVLRGFGAPLLVGIASSGYLHELGPDYLNMIKLPLMFAYMGDAALGWLKVKNGYHVASTVLGTPILGFSAYYVSSGLL